MTKMRPPIIPEQPVPVLPDDQVRKLLDSAPTAASGDARDMAIIRVFLDTGMRLEGIGGLRYSVEDADLSDVGLGAGVVRVVAKGPTLRWSSRSARSPHGT